MKCWAHPEHGGKGSAGEWVPGQQERGPGVLSWEMVPRELTGKGQLVLGVTGGTRNRPGKQLPCGASALLPLSN